MKLNAKAEKAVSEKKDVIMEDVESNFAPQELLQSQPLTPELPLRDVVRNMQLGFPLEQENKDIGQETKALHVDDVNVGRLHIANCQR